MKLPLSVVIPTMNRPTSLDRTLDYIFNGFDIPGEIIIIDQSTTDSLRSEVHSIALKYSSNLTTIVYCYQSIPSITRARNLGLKRASNDIVVFSDDDVDVSKTTYRSVYSLMNDSSISLVGGYCAINDTKNSILGYIFFMSSFFKRKRGHMSAGIYGRFPESRGHYDPTEWAMGFFFVIRKSLSEKWQISFDENLLYYAYAEDLDFTYGYYLSSKASGYKCILSTELLVNHNISTEYRIPKFSETVMQLSHREYIRNKYKRNFVLFIWNNLGMLLYKIIKKENPKDYIKACHFFLSNLSDIRKGQFHYSEYI